MIKKHLLPFIYVLVGIVFLLLSKTEFALFCLYAAFAQHMVNFHTD